jgi:hypothetical protein
MFGLADPESQTLHKAMFRVRDKGRRKQLDLVRVEREESVVRSPDKKCPLHMNFKEIVVWFC